MDHETQEQLQQAPDDLIEPALPVAVLFEPMEEDDEDEAVVPLAAPIMLEEELDESDDDEPLEAIRAQNILRLDQADDLLDIQDNYLQRHRGLFRFMRRRRETRQVARQAVAVPQPNNNNDPPRNDPDRGRNIEGDVGLPLEDVPLLHLQGRNVSSLSSYLLDIIREDHFCASVLSGQWLPGCQRIVQHAQDHPEESFFISISGRTPLHEACLRGSCRHVISALLQANAMGATERDNQGNTPLHLLFVDFSTRSILHPQEMDAIVSDLLNVNPTFLSSAINLDQSTALHMACAAPETTVDPSSLVQLVSANPTCATKVNSRGETPLFVHCKRHNASTVVARIIYEANPEALMTLDNLLGWAPLHHAAANRNIGLVQYLVQANPQAAKVQTRKGESPLHLLLSRQDLTADELPAVDVLLQADPGSVSQQDSIRSYTPLHLTCRNPRASLAVIERLLQANPAAATMVDAENYLPLHHACEIGCDTSIVAVILQAHPLSAKAMTRKQDSALSLACTCNVSVDTVSLLIQANPEALTKKNDYGFAPLHCVCRAYQPRMGIVQALLDACPSCVTLQTHAGETPIHLAGSNSGAFVGVLQLLTLAQNQRSTETMHEDLVRTRDEEVADRDWPFPSSSINSKTMTNKVGNTPLHDACFRGSPFEHIETLAMANPEWIMVRNNAGYSPFQILCKNGRIDERIVTTFSHIGGPQIFSVIDSTGNTPLHSAMREDMDVATLKCLIRALPDALHSKTIYGDLPLHLAIFRRADADVVREVALVSSSGHVSPVLEPNSAGQTPIGIAMEEFRSLCRGSRFCCVVSEYRPEQQRAFQVLAALVKILFYGSTSHDQKQQSLIRASVALHRQDIRLDPAFIRRAIHLYPEEARVMDEEGNYPLHIEASIPIEKMSLLDASAGCCEGMCHRRMGILRMLLEVFPDATRSRNRHGQFALGLMLQNGRVWGHDVALALRAFPPALHWHKGVDDRILPHIFERAGKECGADTLFALLTSRPDILGW